MIVKLKNMFVIWKQKCCLSLVQWRCCVCGTVLTNHVKGFNPNAVTRVCYPLLCSWYFPSVLSFPGNRKQNMLTLMIQITQHAVVTHFSCFMHYFTAFPSFLMLPWEFCQCTQCCLEHDKTITLKGKGKCGKLHLPPPSLHPRPVS